MKISLERPRRSQIYVGFKCNIKCEFCYYISRLKEPMFDISFVIKQIDYAYNYGIRDFEITGGEPGLYSDLLKVILYIKNKGCKVAVITNGTVSNDIIKNIDEILLSIHPGHKIRKDQLRVIDKVKEYNKIFRTNSVLHKGNYNFLLEATNFLKAINPDIINFLPINYPNNGLHIDYIMLRPLLKAAFDICGDIKSYVRFMPFCDMEGYEQHIVGNKQHAYDWFDWNPELINNIDLCSRNASLGEYGSTTDKVIKDIQKEYSKSSKCIICKFDNICDGMENKRLINQCIPTIGKKVNIFEYFNNFELYNALYSKYNK